MLEILVLLVKINPLDLNLLTPDVVHPHHEHEQKNLKQLRSKYRLLKRFTVSHFGVVTTICDKILLLVFFAVALMGVGRIFYMQVVNSEFFQGMAKRIFPLGE